MSGWSDQRTKSSTPFWQQAGCPLIRSLSERHWRLPAAFCSKGHTATTPVSPLFYAGRREDLAFEKEHGSSADQRHHVRLWQVLESGAESRPVWLGSATFDRGVELSRYTGQITHRIAPDIDEERDTLVHDLSRTGMSKTIYQVTGIGPTLIGRNGEGDRYYTDGEIKIIVTLSSGETASETPQMIRAPAGAALRYERLSGRIPRSDVCPDWRRPFPRRCSGLCDEPRGLLAPTNHCLRCKRVLL